MFTINYALLKGKRQWLRRWLCPSLQQPRLLRWQQHQRPQHHDLLLPQHHLPPVVVVVVAAQPLYRLPAQEQTTARWKGQLTPNSKKKGRQLAIIKESKCGGQLTRQDNWAYGAKRYALTLTFALQMAHVLKHALSISTNGLQRPAIQHPTKRLS